MTRTMTRYAITARRWEHGWELFDGDDILTQAAVLAEAEAEARDYLATEHGGEPQDYEVTVTADLGGVEAEVSATMDRIAHAQAESVAAGERWRELAAVLRTVHHLSVRDTAAVMNISPGRVSQLLDPKSPKGSPTRTS